ncbi:hypothetical protein ACICHK_39525 [Streptomyces sp. AHU1]|uniref:hypothetical protein n=1 Tax=Streptomyces sp. AHU1 TaxID=3377215 RepID=UPI003877FB1C
MITTRYAPWRKGVLLDPAQCGAQAGHRLLRPDDPDRLRGAVGAGGQMAAAGGGGDERDGLGDGRDAGGEDVGVATGRRIRSDSVARSIVGTRGRTAR